MFSACFYSFQPCDLIWFLQAGLKTKFDGECVNESSVSHEQGRILYAD